jgi:predicted dehydrogenase/aryl-alcohol dehydrogenase-like predicted oxidoreductase
MGIGFLAVDRVEFNQDAKEIERMTVTTQPGKLAWGILGTGGIARRFAGALQASQTSYLLAVGSRTQEAADKFAGEFDVSRRYASYDALLSDPEVGAVYISLPNHLHALWTVRCAEAGKHILCEKPLATNLGEAMTAVEAARYHGVFLMEAFMYRCHPQTARLAELLRQKAIGDVRVIEAHFSFNMHGPRENIRQQNTAAGGGIMDVGCYCSSMARLVAGAALGQDFSDPLEVKGCGHIGEVSRVDEWAAATLRFPGDVVANLTCGIQVSSESTLRIWGSTGHIVVPNPWFPAAGDNEILIHHDGQQEPERVLVVGQAELYTIEADTVARNLDAHQGPVPCMSWADSLGNMSTLDRWRKEIGLVFDNEKPEALTLPASGHPLLRRPDAPMTYSHVAGVEMPISRIVMGSMVFRRDNLPFACAMLDHYVELGGNCIDTAYVYGTEATIGHWLRLRNNREQMLLIGKGAHTPECHPEGLTRQLMQTLENLQTGYLDLYFMHRDNLAIPVGEFVECLNEHVRAGRIRAFGGSNWTMERIEAANDYARAHGLTGFAASSPNLALAVWNQPMWGGCVAASDPASRAWYNAQQLPLFAWSSQASGFFTGRYSPADRANPAAAEVVRTWFNDDNFRRLARARELALQKGVSSTQIALAYVLCQPFPTWALIGPRTIEETRTSVAALDVALTPEELRWLNLEM